jgi:hypothetical protein
MRLASPDEAGIGTVESFGGRPRDARLATGAVHGANLVQLFL